MRKTERLALVVTHADAHKNLPNISLLEVGFGVDTTDWIILSLEGWQAVAGGYPGISDAFDRKLLISFHAIHPDLIAVVGHAGGRHGAGLGETAKLEVCRIVRRVRALILPSRVLGFWTGQQRRLLDCVEPDDGRSPDSPNMRRRSNHASLRAHGGR